MSFSFFPNLLPRTVNPQWFIDKIDEEAELTQMEADHQIWVCSSFSTNSYRPSSERPQVAVSSTV